MPSRPSLVVCPECSNYVKASECRCPSCGICFRGREGRATTAAAILTMGLMTVACGNSVQGGTGAGGAGGEGGDMPTTSGGYGNPTSASGYTVASSGAWGDSVSTGGGAGGDGGAGANGGAGGAGANGGADGNGGG